MLTSYSGAITATTWHFGRNRDRVITQFHSCILMLWSISAQINSSQRKVRFRYSTQVVQELFHSLGAHCISRLWDWLQPARHPHTTIPGLLYC